MLGHGDWDQLQIPVGLAFLFKNTVQEQPGSASVVEGVAKDIAGIG